MKNTINLLEVIQSLEEERGLDRAVLADIVCEGMLAAYSKKYPDLELKVSLDQKTGDLVVEVKKNIVTSVENSESEITVRKAKGFDTKAEVGGEIWLPFDEEIGRVEILRAKQVITGKIRAVEALAVYNEFIGKKGTIVVGVIHKCEFGGASVKLQDDAMAFLPKSLTLPSDKCVPGHPVRALLKEVYEEPRKENQLILDRASAEFLQRLVELEVPEVFEKIVEIKKIVRAPGYKSKMVVASNDKNIDPVGTCVGVGGGRIKPILKEIGGERIDIISASGSLESFIKDALKPAEVSRVEIKGDDSVNVWLEDDQRSLAIGKMGQNISLASQLVGRHINLVQSQESAERDALVDDEANGAFDDEE
ncbi:MAG: Transcription termination factor NusA [candidate division TM6 bacterium GW2011_GWF2_32_72]|nr:MAG: Transcription termination factor NusA [candidate division TM6 bacterium GW2011_GWF2_32_72]